MSPDRAHVHWNGTFSDDEKNRLLRSSPSGALDSILSELREKCLSGDGLNPYLWFDQKYFLPDDILTKVDRMSMAHAVEVRPPFLDHRIVEFAASLPASFKIHGSKQKFILKELMKGKLPSAVLRRPKIGFDIPAHEWLRGPLRSLLLDSLSTGASEYSGLFHFETIQARVRQHFDRRANLGYHLWGLMILFLWMKKWRVQTAPLSLPASRVTENVLSI